MRRANRLETGLLVLLLASLAGCMPMPTQQPVAEAIEDGVVTARIKERLTEDPLTKVHAIKVETFRGTVELSGFVETDQVRTRALELAKDVSGVKRVRDAMDVRTAYR
jgi:osmotically-inducible protein OsmY